ncbi:beta-1,3-galactosyltransferase 5-like, partial [Ctenocephalides felis]|uniref:beta-1,3-galactosyltransferase 5-like n=1 Tax=Ctenocephalides felis TaxID=7515 RepID=UPI000E6E118D
TNTKKIQKDYIFYVISFVIIVLRSAHRRALSNEQLWDIQFKRVFLLANIPKKDKYAITQEALNNENERFHDMIQGNFEEAYRNLTYKHIMGLKWATENCRHVEFIIKMDDDIIVDIYGILHVIDQNVQPKELLMGYVLKDMTPKREPANKWFVKHEEFASTTYPTFLSGWLYITNPHTAKLLVAESENIPYFWIDDVYVTGILADSLNIKHTSINKYYTVHPEYIECCINDWKKYQFKCDFLICTNGNDFNLFVKFATLALNCNKLYKCLDRPFDKKLENTCVAHRRINPPDRGESIIQSIKL